MTAQPGLKADSSKPRPTLIFRHMPRALLAVIEAGEYGAKKYGESPEVCNWDKVPDGQQRYTDAMLRHQLDEFRGEERDADSGLLHAAHAAWNALVRLELMLREQAAANDNAPEPGELREIIIIEGVGEVTLPPGYSWVAQDMCGAWWAYDSQPGQGGHNWLRRTPSERKPICLASGKMNPNWKETLRRVRD